MTYATIDVDRAHETDKRFRKALAELVSEYLGDGLAESAAVDAMRDEIEQINNYD